MEKAASLNSQLATRELEKAEGKILIGWETVQTEVRIAVRSPNGLSTYAYFIGPATNPGFGTKWRKGGR